ncbi:MAG: hypothetical protein KDB27_34915 [Planctomycetales bacterium]|nr:hypothetical protein [Planctomycetales bacterium]
MNTQGLIYSYAAGTTSKDPYGFRVIEGSGPSRVSQILNAFPDQRRFFNSSAMIISGYTASLGLTGDAPFVDTYLHFPTFLRAMKLAACERRQVIYASQPLSGAEMFFRLCDSNVELPRSLLWAVGGYYLPLSLEKAVRDRLEQCRCKLSCLHSYGIAEIGHSCFVATKRFACGRPRYRKVADEVQAEVSTKDNRLTLTNCHNGRTVATSDQARLVGDEWQITSGSDRLAAKVLNELESWSNADWQQRTGYLQMDGTNLTIQLRENASKTAMKNELAYYDYLARFGGSFFCKPTWSDAAAS